MLRSFLSCTTRFTLLATVAAWAGAGAAAHAQPAGTELFVRDAWTGLGVPAVELVVGAPEAGGRESGRVETFRAEGAGRFRLGTSLDGERLEVRAPGYRTMVVPAFERDRTSALTGLWLLPSQRPEELRADTIKARTLPATSLLHGHVVDPETGLPVVGATVLVEGQEARTTTDARGYFLLYTKGSKVLEGTDVPDFADLLVSAPGRRTVRLAHIALLENDAHFIVDQPAGTGEIVRDLSHKMFPREGRENAAEPQVAVATAPNPALAAGEPLVGGDDPSHAILATAGGLQLVNPPDNINVNGYGLIPIEVYVARGLCAEWISSWGANSIASGAIAYRSYGAWNQINVGSICTTTSCQVYNNTYVAACDTAAQKTTGMLLQRSGAVARSEYSAENNARFCSTFSCVNNDLSCGNGSAGSPAAGWPCLSDNHLFDQGPGSCCFGHGRGMCQWGTHAWSRGGQLWNWITDKYFNNFGAGTGQRTMFMTSPFDIVSATFPASVTRGATITINETVRSYTDWNQGQIMLGASLTGPSSISDPARDKKVSILARTSFAVQSRDTAVSRQFLVPATAVRGTYNLIVALWMDTNGNNVIDSADKPLRTLTYPSAIVVN